MNELLAKLTDLSYEFFGVILPGIVGCLFTVLWWMALGPVAPKWTWGTVPELTVESARRIVDSLNEATGWGIAIPILLAAYFLGHILLWVARSGKADEAAAERTMLRLRRSVAFKIPKREHSYDPSLQPLLDVVQAKFSADGKILEWRQLFPVAKSYLAKNVPYSLISTYQNKYTLHRSLTAAAAAWLWLNVGGVIGGSITAYIWQISPRWGLLGLFAIIALVLVVGFSSSYLYHWQMFGNTIITESYAALHEPAK